MTKLKEMMKQGGSLESTAMSTNQGKKEEGDIGEMMKEGDAEKKDITKRKMRRIIKLKKYEDEGRMLLKSVNTKRH